jgi:uracil-DNA glycosylase
MHQIKIHESWKNILSSEFSKEYFLQLQSFIETEKNDFEVYPTENEFFEAFNKTPFDKVKVVLIGQDPYHGKGQANGLSFSVANGVKIPPSLKNVFKELNADLGVEIPISGNLETWAKQGVLLLNATLTVRAKTAGSHQKKGWEIFTDQVIRTISNEKQDVVFLLWGNFAHGKENLINSNKHLILKAAHPSPLARGAFFGSKHFSKTNNFLVSKNLGGINWKI